MFVPVAMSYTQNAPYAFHTVPVERRCWARFSNSFPLHDCNKVGDTRIHLCQEHYKELTGKEYK